MTRLEKCVALKDKGYTYAPETGKVYGVSGKEIKKKNKGYIEIVNTTNKIYLLAHHYAWFMTYGNVDFIELDHKDRNPSNNRIDNLRISNRKQQNQNRTSKGYYWDKHNNKWHAQISYNKKTIFLGLFNTEEEASQAYIKSKKIYHNI